MKQITNTKLVLALMLLGAATLLVLVYKDDLPTQAELKMVKTLYPSRLN